MEDSSSNIMRLVSAAAELTQLKERKAERAREWYNRNRERLKAHYHATKAQRQEYYAAHRDHILEQQRKRYYEQRTQLLLAPPEPAGNINPQLPLEPELK